MSSKAGASESRVHAVARSEGFLWGNAAEDTYFSRAERDVDAVWDALIRPVLGPLSYDTALDIAAGRGRNSVKLATRAKKVICVDINPENVEFPRERFRGDHRFHIILNDGVTLGDIDSDTVDLAYSFDAMVHFDMEIVISYVNECFRVLRPGMHAFIHHSNYSSNPGDDFRNNPHWRNFMSLPLFRHIVIRAGFSILLSESLSWGSIADLDGIGLLRKP
jgi:SAM-dependent methyltransferase